MNNMRAFYAWLTGLVGKPMAPPVDRTQRELVGGGPVTDDHRELKPNGQQKDYVVLSPAERGRGFVRPVRRSYVHVGRGATFDGPVLIKLGEGGCGTLTKMSIELAETYARDPGFYSGTFCVGCGKHFPLDQFVWDDSTDQVGS